MDLTSMNEWRHSPALFIRNGETYFVARTTKDWNEIWVAQRLAKWKALNTRRCQHIAAPIVLLVFFCSSLFLFFSSWRCQMSQTLNENEKKNICIVKFRLPRSHSDWYVKRRKFNRIPYSLWYIFLFIIIGIYMRQSASIFYAHTEFNAKLNEKIMV